MTAETIHSCSYSCDRPECIRAQRDELAAKVEALLAEVEEMQHRLDREESDHGRTIDQRDAAEAALSRMFQAVTGRTAEWSSAWGYVDAIEEVEEHVATLAQQPAAGAGCHCGTCTCNPSMTPAVRFDLSPAQTEGAIREHLIRLGWTPPEQRAKVEALRAEVAEAREFSDKMANAIGNDQLRRFIEKHGEPVPLTIRMRAAEARAERLAEALRELVDVFSESGMYDEEVFVRARTALAQENRND